MKLTYKYFLVFIFIINSLKIYSNNNDLYTSFLESMFTCRYNDTKKILAHLDKHHSNEFMTKLAFANFWLIMYETSGKADKYLSLCNKNANAVTESIINKKNKTDDDIYFLISAKSILLKIQFNKKNYIKVAGGINDIIKYFEYATEHENNIRMKLISGMYNYYIETAKVDYPVAYPLLLFYPPGDKQKGLRLLKECAKEKDKRIKVRSLLFLARIYCRDEKVFSKSAYYYKKLLNMYPGNLIWRSEYIKCLHKYNYVENAKEQKEILKEKVNESEHLTNEQKDFFLGVD